MKWNQNKFNFKQLTDKRIAEKTLNEIINYWIIKIRDNQRIDK